MTLFWVFIMEIMDIEVIMKKLKHEDLQKEKNKNRLTGESKMETQTFLKKKKSSQMVPYDLRKKQILVKHEKFYKTVFLILLKTELPNDICKANFF